MSTLLSWAGISFSRPGCSKSCATWAQSWGIPNLREPVSVPCHPHKIFFPYVQPTSTSFCLKSMPLALPKLAEVKSLYLFYRTPFNYCNAATRSPQSLLCSASGLNNPNPFSISSQERCFKSLTIFMTVLCHNGLTPTGPFLYWRPRAGHSAPRGISKEQSWAERGNLPWPAAHAVLLLLLSVLLLT